MFQGIVMYLLGCIVAHHPLGPTGFVGFLYHCFQWTGE
jgi:hypothetical protein